MAVTCTQLDVSKIRTDGGTQPRAELDQSRVEHLAELLRDGVAFKDSVVVFYDGTNYWLGDGFHRLAAYILAMVFLIDVEIKQGTQREAKLYAWYANTRHGVPLLLSDRKRAARALLEDPEWREWSDREIGRITGLHHETVGAIRRELYGDFRQTSTNQPVEPSGVAEEVGKFPTNQEKRKTVENFFKDFPGSQELSDREIARRCGVDHKTVGAFKKELLEEKQRAEEVAPEPTLEPEPIIWEPEITATTEPLAEPEPIPEQPPAIEPEVEPEPPRLETEPLNDTPIAEEPEPISEPVTSIVEPEIVFEPVSVLFETRVEEESAVVVNPEPEIEPSTKEESAPITISGMLAPSEEVLREREIKRQQTQERNEQLREKGAELPTGKYACLVVDPPWPMKKIEREVRPNQVEFDYPTMSEEELKSFELPSLAGEDCHLYLWTTQKYLPMALRLAEHWGFKYQCLMTWVKNVGPTPFSWMYTTEHVLFCSKGNLPLLAIGRRLDFVAKGREHSRKPDVFYDLVRAVSPGPRIDVFSRERRDGFEQYGYEVEKYVPA